MKKTVLFTLALLISLSSLSAGARTNPRPRAASRGFLGGISSGTAVLGVGVILAATGIALVAINNSESTHSH